MALAHKDQPWQAVDADFGFGPITVHFRKMNIWERREIRKAQEKGLDDFAVASLVLRGRDEGGSRLWPSAADRDKIVHEFDPDEIDRVIAVMYGVEDQAGN